MRTLALPELLAALDAAVGEASGFLHGPRGTVGRLLPMYACSVADILAMPRMVGTISCSVEAVRELCDDVNQAAAVTICEARIGAEKLTFAAIVERLETGDLEAVDEVRFDPAPLRQALAADPQFAGGHDWRDLRRRQADLVRLIEPDRMGRLCQLPIEELADELRRAREDVRLRALAGDAAVVPAAATTAVVEAVTPQIVANLAPDTPRLRTTASALAEFLRGRELPPWTLDALVTLADGEPCDLGMFVELVDCGELDGGDLVAIDMGLLQQVVEANIGGVDVDAAAGPDDQTIISAADQWASDLDGPVPSQEEVDAALAANVELTQSAINRTVQTLGEDDLAGADDLPLSQKDLDSLFGN